MKILIVSYAFYPSTGGIESSALMLLNEWIQELNHEVKVVTHTLLGTKEELSHIEVQRRPSLGTFLQMVRWADVVYHHNPSLTYLFPSFFGIPTVFSIRTWIRRSCGKVAWRDRLKLWILSNFSCISNSQATAESLPFNSKVIENSYDASIFNTKNEWQKRSGIAFVGRLVSDKGLDTALIAIRLLRKNGWLSNFLVIGDGPLRKEYEQLASNDNNLSGVVFLGKLEPCAIAEWLNKVKYLVIPSKWEEPFGIVALEGIACGCIPIGTNQGGLVDAIGKCGPLFEKDDFAGLAGWISKLENEPELAEKYRKEFARHLELHSPKFVASSYQEVFYSSIRASGGKRIF